MINLADLKSQWGFKKISDKSTPSRSSILGGMMQQSFVIQQIRKKGHRRPKEDPVGIKKDLWLDIDYRLEI